MCAPIKLNFLFCNRKLLFDALSNVYQTDLWSVRGIPEADPGEGLRGLQPPLWGAFVSCYCFILPKLIINKIFLQSFSSSTIGLLVRLWKGNVHLAKGVCVKIKERLTADLRTKDLPFTIMADESTDPHSNQEISSLCLRFVDQSSPNDPHVKECLINFMHFEQTNATMISRKILESLSDPSVSLDPSNIWGQAYDGTSVMSSGKEGVQTKIKEISPSALFTHCSLPEPLHRSIMQTVRSAKFDRSD